LKVRKQTFKECNFKMSSLKIADSIFKKLLQEVPVGMDQMARESGAFSRSRAIGNPSELFRAVLLYCGLDYSLREVAANLTSYGERVSDEAVRKRLAGCERWLGAMLKEMLPSPKREIKGCSGRLVLVDTTSVQAPGAVTTDYRLHLGWDWSEQRVGQLLVTDNRIGESLKLFDWSKNDVVLADAGYAKAPQLTLVKEKGADYIVRCLPRQIRLYSESGERLNVVRELQDRTGEPSVSIKVGIEAGTTLQSAWLHAFRLPERIASEARRRVKRRAQKQSRGIPRPETIYLAGWMIILTSIEPEQMSAADIAKLYRARWQIEIVIKRLKSVLKLDALRARRGSRLAHVYLLGKMLYALIIEQRALRSENTREIEWRMWKMISEQIRGWITLSLHEDKAPSREALEVLKERPRKRERLRNTIAGIRLQTRPLFS
jgi:hypothetical protein